MYYREVLSFSRCFRQVYAAMPNIQRDNFRISVNNLALNFNARYSERDNFSISVKHLALSC